MAATTPVDRRVADLVMRLMVDDFGNAGSRTHSMGTAAKTTVERAREQLARVVDCQPNEVIFTSGATEADNLATLGLHEFALKTKRMHIVSTSIEHKAILEPLEHLAEHGFEVTFVNPQASGVVEASDILKQVRDDTVLVSVMHVNNETGVIQPLDAIALGLQDHPCFLHTDAAQGFGKVLNPLTNRRIDMISVSGHKFFAPKGIGALIVRRRGVDPLPLSPLAFGGGQESGLRPGTIPVALVAGLGLAAEIALAEHDERQERVMELAHRIEAFTFENDGQINGDRSRCAPNIINVAFRGLDSEAFIVATKHLVAVSNGAACSSHAYSHSHVLEAMNLEPWRVRGAIRFSFSHDSVFPDEKLLQKAIQLARF